MGKGNDDTGLMPLVATGAALVAVGTALGAARPLIGLAVLLGALVLLTFTLLRMVRRQKARPREGAPRRSDAWLLAVLAGMMLSGCGAALSAVQAPVIGLAIALGGGVLCGVGAWRMIVGQG